MYCETHLKPSPYPACRPDTQQPWLSPHCRLCRALPRTQNFAQRLQRGRRRALAAHDAAHEHLDRPHTVLHGDRPLARGELRQAQVEPQLLLCAQPRRNYPQGRSSALLTHQLLYPVPQTAGLLLRNVQASWLGSRSAGQLQRSGRGATAGVRAEACRTSLAACGMSILLPSTRKGTLPRESSCDGDNVR